MRQKVILDTGPLVSLLNPNDTYHQWTVAQMKEITPPFLTCEAVITEACFLVSKYRRNSEDIILELLDNGFMVADISLNNEVNRIRSLMRKYADVPMSLADACLVRLAELYAGPCIVTLDSDFSIYRIDRNQAIELIIPNSA